MTPGPASVRGLFRHHTGPAPVAMAESASSMDSALKGAEGLFSYTLVNHDMKLPRPFLQRAGTRKHFRWLC